MMGAVPHDKYTSVRCERPRHRVVISKPFFISVYACTQDLYESVMGKNPSQFKGSTHPVECLSWCDAVLFCNKLSEKEGLQPVYIVPDEFESALNKFYAQEDDSINALSTKVRWNENGLGYRLPTEAEWEYAARGGEEHIYSGSDNIDEVGWYGEDYQTGSTHRVGQKQSNGFGLYDMTGNVCEWVWDTAVIDGKYRMMAESLYPSSSRTDPVVNVESVERVIRGGSFYNYNARYSRLSLRSSFVASRINMDLGFRFLRTLVK